MCSIESASLGDELDVIVYGTGGRPVIVFPTFDCLSTSWEEHGMLEGLATMIGDGEIQVFCVDSRDDQSWYANAASIEYRSERLEAWLSCIEGDIVPFVTKESGSKELPVVAGCGVGATNATVAMLRRPDLFGGLLAISGTYDARSYTGGAMDGVWQQASPLDMVTALDAKDAMTKLLKERVLVFCCGQGAGEDGLDSQRRMQEALGDRGIVASFEYWGYDVSHDWVWWREMVKQLLPCALEPEGMAKRAYAAFESARQEAEERLGAAKQALADATSAAKQDAADKAARVKEAEERVKREEHEVAEKTKAADAAQAVANEARAAADKVAAELAEAEGQYAEAQGKADAAHTERSQAEWFAGEARAAVQQALDEQADAKVYQEFQVAAAEQALDEARGAQERAVADAAAAKAKIDEIKRQAKTPKKRSTRRQATKRASTTKAKKTTATKKTTGRPASSSSAKKTATH